MAQATVRNTSSGPLSVPAPFNVSLRPGQQSTLRGIDAAQLALSAGLSVLRSRGYISIDIDRDSSVDDQLESADIAAATVTEGNITVSVDYNDPLAIDPPTGIIFKSQLAVDNFLNSIGASKFKHLQTFYNALPAQVNHLVTMNLAAGVHRPHPTLPSATVGWSFNTKILGSLGGISFVGQPPSLYTPSEFGSFALAITGSQTASGDPWIDVAGTPFVNPAWAQSTVYAVGNRVVANNATYVCRTAGTSASSGTGPSGGGANKVDNTVRWDYICAGTAFLRGYFVILNTGQAAIIHDHTSSRLFLLDVLSPASPTSISFIGRPSTIIRNGLNDASATPRGTFTGVAMASLNLLGSGVGNRFTYQDIMFDPWGGSSNGFTCNTGGSTRLVRFVYDGDTLRRAVPGTTTDGNAMSFTVPGGAANALSATSIVFAGLAQTFSGIDGLLTIVGSLSCTSAFFEGSENGISLRGPISVNNLFAGLVCRGVGFSGGDNLEGSIIVDNGAQLDLIDVGSGFLGAGKINELRNANPGLPAVIHFRNGGHPRPDNDKARFLNNPIPCVRVGTQGNLDLSGNGANGYLDGGGNTDVGIDIVGPGAIASLNTGTNITGTVGDVRLGGVVQTYASIPSTGSGHANSASAVRRA